MGIPSPQKASPTGVGRLDVEKLRALLPGVGTAGLATTAASATPMRGRVLKLKLGFNPNSSSVGTTVVVFLWSLVASGAVLGFTAAVLAYRFQRRRKAQDPLAPTVIPTPEEPS
jgi:hypothetical protein